MNINLITTAIKTALHNHKYVEVTSVTVSHEDTNVVGIEVRFGHNEEKTFRLDLTFNCYNLIWVETGLTGVMFSDIENITREIKKARKEARK